MREKGDKRESKKESTEKENTEEKGQFESYLERTNSDRRGKKKERNKIRERTDKLDKLVKVSKRLFQQKKKNELAIS